MTSAHYRFRSIAALGATTALWLIINIVGDAVITIWSLVDMALLANPALLSADAFRVWEMTGVIGLAQIAVFIFTAVMVARWIYRASANTHAAVRRLDTSPPWAVGWYFIPFANLWKPFQAMSEIVRANRPNGPELPLGLWWGLWLTSGIAGNIGARLNLMSTSTDMFILASSLTLVSGVAGVGGALCLRRIVLAVTDAQTAHKQAEVF